MAVNTASASFSDCVGIYFRFWAGDVALADIVASIERLRRDSSVRELALFCTTANHVALLAAANLSSHLSLKIKFMEWDRDHAK